MAIERKSAVLAFVCIFASSCFAQFEAQKIPGVPIIPVDATIEQAKQAVAVARAGRKLTPKSWPNGARVAVCISFDVDNEYMANAQPLPVPMSGGEYGATTGLLRVLDLLDRQQIPASFYIPAVSAALHPDMIGQILKSKRHEIGVHGWIHEYLPTIGDAAKEEQLLNQAIDYLTKATGKRPVGYRAPSWAFSPSTLGQIIKADFLYDSSMMAMDQPYEIDSEGKPTGMIELPVTWILDDYPYYGENAEGSMPRPESVYEIYKAEFDGAYQERTAFILTMHPHISGHRSRIAQVDRLITYMKSKPGVWFATEEEVANYIKKSNANLK
jgi:peptidoglycan/xylan/chitin deacetylase (PgdA/CDA1 family)